VVHGVPVFKPVSFLVNANPKKAALLSARLGVPGRSPMLMITHSKIFLSTVDTVKTRLFSQAIPHFGALKYSESESQRRNDGWGQGS